MSLTGYALKNQPLVIIVVFAMVVFAGMALQNFPSQEDPPITVREAVVTRDVLRASGRKLGKRVLAAA